MLARRRETVRILLLSANPLDTATLRLGQEAREIEEALDRAHVRAVVRPVTAVRPGDIPRKLRKFRPNFVHFSGHGESDKGIILEDDNGRRSPLPRETLASLFSIYKGVKCVILNSCHSAVQAELISQFVPYVIGMKAAISDKAAIKFS